MKNSDVYEMPVFRLQLVQEGTVPFAGIASPEAVAAHLQDLACADREQMVAVHLNTKNRPMGRQTVSIGTLNSTLVDPAMVFKAALMAGAFAIILAHNHPSGDPTPSREDDRVTERIAKAGRLLEVRLLDHVILSPSGGHYSYQEQNPACLEGGGA
jgi:DNA repair protein RadC